MYCTNCGASIPNEAKFCPECGTKVAATTSVTAAPLVAEPAPKPPLAAEPAGAAELHTSPPVLPEKEVVPPGPVGPRKSSLKGAMTDGTAAEAAVLGMIIAGIGVLIFLPNPIGIRIGIFAFYLLVAFGIWKMSRIAAIIGLLIALANVAVAGWVIFKFPMEISAGRVAPALLFTFLWIKWLYQAVSGNFAYHRARAAKS